MNTKQIIIAAHFVALLAIPSAKLMGSEEPSKLVFNDASNPLLGRTYKLQKPIEYDNKTFATAAALSAYLQAQHGIDVGAAEYHAQEKKFHDAVAKMALLATGNSYLRYDVKDRILGIGIDDKGSNIYGIVLMFIREKMRNEQKFANLSQLPPAKL